MMFKTIADLLEDNQSLTLTIFKTNGKLTVGVLPRPAQKASDDVKAAFASIPTISMTNTPEMLDATFIPELLNPLNQSLGELNTVAAGLKAVSKAAEDLKKKAPAKGAKPAAAKPANDGAPETEEDELEVAASQPENSPVINKPAAPAPAPSAPPRPATAPPRPATAPPAAPSAPPRPAAPAPMPPKPGAPAAPKPAMSPAKYNSLMDKMKIGGQSVVEAEKIAAGFSMTPEQATGLKAQADKYRVTGAGGQTQL